MRVIPDIDGFYGEPAAFDATLEVDLLLADAVPDDLEDDWFDFDDTAVFEAPIEMFDDIPTTPWQRFGDWLRSFGRAA